MNTQYKKSIFIFILLILAGVSCNNVLDEVDNLGQYPPDKVWSSEILTNAYLANLYAETMPGWPTSNGASADEAGPGILAVDAVTTQNGSFKRWSYSSIRKINILLEEIESGTLENDFRNRIIGEALFMRAWHYFEMVIYHGGVPIISGVQDLDDDLQVARNSTEECFEFILSDLNRAEGLLPVKQTGANLGRIDQGIVKALKSRVYLYMASPLFNPENPYNNSQWQSAYNAALEAKSFLESNGYGLIDNYDDIFKNEGNKEAIMITQYTNPGRTSNRDQCLRPLAESKNCTGQEQPVWGMVEAYPMADGKQPGASDKYAYDVQSYWENRDPRFYQTIVYNGDLFELSGKTGRRQYTTNDLVPYVLAHPDDIFGDRGPGRTGFFSKRGLEINLTSEEVETNSTDWIEIRFAEILFNLAEAANETGKMDEAIEVLIQIRERAGIEPGDDGQYGIPSNLSREDLRDLIISDKRIEFAFEGKRLEDLRRTRRWHLLDGETKYGLEAFLKPEFIDSDGNLTKTNLLPEDFTYEVRQIINDNPNMVIPETYYFIPLRVSDIEVNPNLEQTIGWDNGTFDPTLN